MRDIDIEGVNKLFIDKFLFYRQYYVTWCWRRMEKISWTDRLRNEEVLLWVKEQRNILHEISQQKANWIGYILHRNWLLRQVIEGNIKRGIEVTGRRGRRRRNLLDDLKERRGCYYLKEETMDRTMWTARFGRGFGPVVRQTAKWNEWLYYRLFLFTYVSPVVLVTCLLLSHNSSTFINLVSIFYETCDWMLVINVVPFPIPVFTILLNASDYLGQNSWPAFHSGFQLLIPSIGNMQK
jgi:hypothetical protein